MASPKSSGVNTLKVRGRNPLTNFPMSSKRSLRAHEQNEKPFAMETG